MKPLVPVKELAFPATWEVEILHQPPLIAPVRQYVLPQAVPGEEDALARGALLVNVRPREGDLFLLQCALGFAAGDVLHGVFSTPEPDTMMAVAGGYAYRIDTAAPEQSELLPLRPVVSVLSVHEPASIVLVGFHAVHVLQAGAAWTSPRLSWEGVHASRVDDGVVHGTGWHMRTDRELPFALDLRTRALTGGGFLP